MCFVQQKAKTSKPKYSHSDFLKARREFLEDIYAAVTMEDIVSEVVLNWDQTGIKLVPTSIWTMKKQGKKCVELIDVSDKHRITAVFCIIVLDDFSLFNLYTRGRRVDVILSFSSLLTGT